MKKDKFLSDLLECINDNSTSHQFPRTYLPIFTSPEADIRSIHRRYMKKVAKDIFKFLIICVVSVLLLCTAVLFIVLSAWMP